MLGVRYHQDFPVEIEIHLDHFRIVLTFNEMETILKHNIALHN